MMKKKRKKKNHINPSIIELLCIIGILFVLILAGLRGIQVLSTSSLKNSIYHQEELVIEASKKYISTIDNFDIGKRKKVTLKELVSLGYLKNDIKDENKNSCMNDSYVSIYKDSNKNYQYIPYLFCGNSINYNEASINSYFLNVVKENNRFNISNGILYMELTGGNTIQNTAIELDSYSYKVSVLNDGRWEEVFSSGKIEYHKIEPLYIQERLTKFVNLHEVDDFLLDVSVLNSEGKRMEKEFYLENNVFN